MERDGADDDADSALESSLAHMEQGMAALYTTPGAAGYGAQRGFGGSGAAGRLPLTVDSCHEIIVAQKRQMAELAARVAQLEQGEEDARRRDAAARAQARRDATAAALLRERLADAIAGARSAAEDRDRLSRQLADQTLRARDASTRASQVQSSLATLERDAAFGFASATTVAAAKALAAEPGTGRGAMGMPARGRAERAAIASGRAPGQGSAMTATSPRPVPTGGVYHPPPSRGSADRAAAAAAARRQEARLGYGASPAFGAPAGGYGTGYGATPGAYGTGYGTTPGSAYGGGGGAPFSSPAPSAFGGGGYGGGPSLRPAHSRSAFSSPPPAPRPAATPSRFPGHRGAPAGSQAGSPRRPSFRGSVGMGAGSADGGASVAPSTRVSEDGRAPFVAALLEGLQLTKHCNWPTRPHKRLVWLDASEPRQPAIAWGVPRRGRDPSTARVIPLLKIESINKGIGSDRLRRSGRASREDCYFTIAGREGDSLDLEFPSPSEREAFFDGFYAILAAYGEAFTAELQGPAILAHVRHKVDTVSRHRIRVDAD